MPRTMILLRQGGAGRASDIVLQATPSNLFMHVVVVISQSRPKTLMNR